MLFSLCTKSHQVHTISGQGESKFQNLGKLTEKALPSAPSILQFEVLAQVFLLTAPVALIHRQRDLSQYSAFSRKLLFIKRFQSTLQVSYPNLRREKLRQRKVAWFTESYRKSQLNQEQNPDPPTQCSGHLTMLPKLYLSKLGVKCELWRTR